MTALTPRRAAGYAEGVCLLLLAGFLAYLLTAGDYWMYLNPRFRPLSAATAVVLGGLGLFALFRPGAGASWTRVAAFALVLGLCAASELTVRRDFFAQSFETDPAAPPVTQEALPSRVELGGREYIRINLGELFDIAAKGASDALGQNYAVRGFVYRSPALDARGEFVLFRVAMYCCFADSTAVGFRVRPPGGQPLPDAGAWLVVYGGLTPESMPEDDTPMGESAFTSVQTDYAFAAERLEKAKPQGLGMMYEWKTEEPYAF